MNIFLFWNYLVIKQCVQIKVTRIYTILILPGIGGYKLR